MQQRIAPTCRDKIVRASIQIANHSFANCPVFKNSISKTTSDQGTAFRKLAQTERMPRAMTNEQKPQIADAPCVIIKLP